MTRQNRKTAVRVHSVYLGNRDGTIPPQPPLRFGTYPHVASTVVRPLAARTPAREADREGEEDEREAWAKLAALARDDWLAENPF